VSGETGLSVAPGVSDRGVGCTGTSDGSYSMRTVLCSTTVGRRAALLLTLAVGTVGVVALPAPAADASSSSGGKHGRQAGSLTRTSYGSAARAGEDGSVALGPAVKYVRTPDGTIRQVR
jgi:hypothetical protein